MVTRGVFDSVNFGCFASRRCQRFHCNPMIPMTMSIHFFCDDGK